MAFVVSCPCKREADVLEMTRKLSKTASTNAKNCFLLKNFKCKHTFLGAYGKDRSITFLTRRCYLPTVLQWFASYRKKRDVDISSSAVLGGHLTLTTWASEGGWQGALPPWILKISAKKVVLLISSGKKQVSPLFPPWKNPLVAPPGKNLSGAHDSLLINFRTPSFLLHWISCS